MSPVWLRGLIAGNVIFSCSLLVDTETRLEYRVIHRMPRNLDIDWSENCLLYPTKHTSSAFSEQGSSGTVKLSKERWHCLAQLKKKSDFIYTHQLVNEKVNEETCLNESLGFC